MEDRPEKDNKKENASSDEEENNDADRRRGDTKGRSSKRREDDEDDEEERDRRGGRRRRRDDDDDDDSYYRGGGRSSSSAKVTRTISVDKDDAAFILGRGGTTKKKIARVAGAEIDLDEHDSTITLRGTEKQCDRAEDYLEFVKQQRVGPVTVTLDHRRDDFTAYRVPEDCIGFVMGRNGQTLRSMEEEWGVLMFFAKTKTPGGRSGDVNDGTESLCIFGPLAARRGAEIKVMSAVEHKHPGFCVSSRNELRELERVPGDDDVDGWGTDTVPLSEDNYSYALGAKGSTRRKLAAASGCIIEYVGRLACFAGYKKDRRRGKDYLRWLLEQRVGQSIVEHPRDRDDCSVVKVPTASIAFITGHRGESLRDVERETQTFCFTDGDRADRSRDSENLLIFSYSRDNRDRAADLIEDRIREHKRLGGPRGSGGGRSMGGGRDDSRYGGGGRYGRDDDDRYDRRRRDSYDDDRRESGRRRRRDDDDDDDDDYNDRRRRRRD